MNQDKPIRIIVAGDLLPSGKNIRYFESGDARHLFGDEICNLFSSDYSILNLEGPLTNSENKQIKVGPVLKAPIETINGIKALGVKAVSLANNHTTDYGNEGYYDTVKTLENNSIDHIGSGFNEGSVNHYKSVRMGGGKMVCFYCVSETFFNEPTTSNAGVHTYDEYLVCNEIRQLKETHDYIIVLYHGGAEEFPYPTPQTRLRFHRMAESGADFITAQHTHCIGCAEWYKGAYLLYGQGNFLFARMKHEVTKSGLITEVVFDEDCTRIRHHIVNVGIDDLLIYSNIQDMSDFERRSNEVISNKNEIVDKYYRHLYNNRKMKMRWLSAFKGNSFESRLLSKLFPTYYKNTYIEQYNKQQIICIKSVLFGDRYREDAEALCNYMMKN